jgi:hypothetical protein
MAQSALTIRVRSRLHDGYLTDARQDDRPDAVWTVRAALTLDLGDLDRGTADTRLVYTTRPLRWVWLARVGARLLPRWPYLAGLLLGFAGSGWTCDPPDGAALAAGMRWRGRYTPTSG